MKDKIIAFFQNERVKGFTKKVFSKKTFIGVAMILVLVAGLRIGFYLLFEIEGTVSKVDGISILLLNIVEIYIPLLTNLEIRNILLI